MTDELNGLRPYQRVASSLGSRRPCSCQREYPQLKYLLAPTEWPLMSLYADIRHQIIAQKALPRASVACFSTNSAKHFDLPLSFKPHSITACAGGSVQQDF